MCIPKGMNYPAGHGVKIHNKGPIQIFVFVPAVYFPLNSSSALRMQSRQRFLFLSQGKNKEVWKDAEPRQTCNGLKFSEDYGDSTFYVHSLQLYLILSSAWKEILIVSFSSNMKPTLFFSEYSKNTDTDMCLTRKRIWSGAQMKNQAPNTHLDSETNSAPRAHH